MSARDRRPAFGRLNLPATVQTKNNIKITIRERGKVVGRRESKNIWLNTGREYLASLIAYSSFSPLTPERNDRIQYMGFGIGSTAQIALSTTNVPPLSTAYPGTNSQTDTDPTVIGLERPVRISGDSTAYPGTSGDVWLGQVAAPAVHTTATQATFSHLVATTDISYSPFLIVPISEVGLFTAAASPGTYNNVPVAYDSFASISKTTSFSLQIDWTVSF